MATIKNIEPRAVRTYKDEDKYGGMGVRASTSKTEKGVPFILWVQFLRDQANSLGHGKVLNEDKVASITPAIRDIFEKKIAKCGDSLGTVVDVKEENRLIKLYGELKKVLSIAEDDKAKRNAQAQQVLSIVKATVTPTVALRIAPLEIAHGSDTEAVLDQFLKEAAAAFLATPAIMRTQLTAALTAIGVASTTAELQLLISQLKYWHNVAEQALTEKNMEDTPEARKQAEDDAVEDWDNGGNGVPNYPPRRVLKDSAVQTFTEFEMLDAFLQRTDERVLALAPYRELAIEEKSFDSNALWSRLLEHVEKRLSNDQTSLLGEQAAIQAHAARFGAAPKAFVAEAAPAGATAAASPAQGEVAIANAAFSAGYAAGAAGYGDGPERKRAKGDARCFYWNGQECSREKGTGECPFGHSHTPRMSVPFTPAKVWGAPGTSVQDQRPGMTPEQLKETAPQLYEQLYGTGSSSSGGAPLSTGHGYGNPTGGSQGPTTH